MVLKSAFARVGLAGAGGSKLDGDWKRKRDEACSSWKRKKRGAGILKNENGKHWKRKKQRKLETLEKVEVGKEKTP